MKEDPYEIHARYYDAAYGSNEKLKDLPFYLEEASRAEGPILEIGCGTGRITKAIAGLGKEVVGVDTSDAMLQVLRNAIEGSELAARIDLHAGDMRHFQLNRKFPLIILPFRVLQHMYTMEDQLDAFRNLAAHLEEGGRIIFDVFYPRFERVYSGIGEPVEEMSWNDDDGHRLTRTFVKDSYDKIGQSFEGRFIYRTFDGEECIREETCPIRMACYTVPHVQLLLENAGLKAMETYGTFERTPLDNTAKEIIMIAGRKCLNLHHDE